MKTKLWKLLGIALLFLASVSCNQIEIEKGTLMEAEKESQEKELSLFFSGENTGWIESIEGLCEDFMELHPEIRLNMEYSSSDRYTEELKAKEATGEFPDIFEIENPYMFEKAGKLGIFDEEIGDLVENPIVIDGEIYALPFYGTSYGIVYNQVLFKEYGLSIPKNYEDFIKICDFFQSQGIAPLAVGGSEESSVFGWMNYFFLTEVECLENNWIEKREKGEVSFQDDNMKTALKDFQNLMTGGYIMADSLNMGDNQIIANMIDQKVAMYYGTPAMLAKICEAYPQATDSGKTPMGEELEEDTVKLRLGWFYLPDSSGKSVVIDKTGSVWSLSADCVTDEEKKETANLFLEFCYEKDNYRKILQAMYGMPITKDAVLYAAPSVQQEVLKGYRYADRSEEFLGNNKTPENFQMDMKAILDLVAENSISVEDATKLLDEAWDLAEEEQE